MQTPFPLWLDLVLLIAGVASPFVFWLLTFWLVRRP